MIDVTDDQHRRRAGELQNIVATYRKAEDLINIGAYVKGSNPEVDRSIAMIDGVNTYLRQGMEEKIDFGQARRELMALLGN